MLLVELASLRLSNKPVSTSWTCDTMADRIARPCCECEVGSVRRAVELPVV